MFTIGLAATAAQHGVRVLVVDMDPQANASQRLGVSEPAYSMTDVLHSASPGALVASAQASTWPGVWVVAADTALSEIGDDTRMGSEYRLRESMQDSHGFDLVLIDCPPNVGRLTINALIAADDYIVVTEPSLSGGGAVASVLESIAVVRKYHNPTLTGAGIVINGVASREREHALRVSELTAEHGDAIWIPHIPRRAVIAQADGACRPVHEFGAASKEVTDIFETYYTYLTSTTTREKVASA